MTRAAWIAAALSLSLLAPSQAEASSCSGGGGSGGSSSSGGSSGGGSLDWGSSDASSSSDSSSASSTTTCLSGYVPVGLRDCGTFGTWAAPTRLPRFIVGLGMAVRRAPSSAVNQTGHVTHENEGFSYRTVDGGGGGDGASETSLLSTIRFGFGLPKPFYVAVDLELGGVTSAGPTAEMTSTGMRGTPTITQSSAFAVNTLGVVGARTGSGRTSIGLEVAGGMRTVNYSFQSKYLACETRTSIHTVDPLVEIRASAERWLTPWVNVGAVVGGSVIDRGAWTTGVYFGLHTRAFAGER